MTNLQEYYLFEDSKGNTWRIDKDDIYRNIRQWEIDSGEEPVEDDHQFFLDNSSIIMEEEGTELHEAAEVVFNPYDDLHWVH